MSHGAVTFVPLGGAGEIGMNLNVYGYGGQWLIVDCGIGFERTSPWHTEVFLPDPSFLAGAGDRISGMVITHLHLDHLGAVADLWPRLRCPIHLTPLAAALLRPRLAELGLTDAAVVVEHAPGARFDVGPFDVEMMGLTHSTAEMMGLVLRMGATKVFHTGDFKLDPEPQLGPPSELGRLRALDGVDVVVSDSTNATKPGRSRSEGEVRRYLSQRIAGCTGRVAVGTFSSNLARVATLARAAEQVGRNVVLLGRSLEKTVSAAIGLGYLADLPSFVPLRDAGYLPRDRVLFICTGTQAEPGAALTRIARDKHPMVLMDPGDTVIFSSKIIPGNEEAIEMLHRSLRDRGIEVVHELEEPAVHASGHPCRDELAELYEAVRPTSVVPVHGTARHLQAHARFARHLGLDAHEVRNGDVLHLGPGGIRRLGAVRAGRIARKDLRVDG